MTEKEYQLLERLERNVSSIEALLGVILGTLVVLGVACVAYFVRS